MHNITVQAESLPVVAGGDRLLDSFLSGRSERTRKAYTQDIEDFRRWAGCESQSEAVRFFLGSGQGSANGMALDFRNALLEKGLSPSTINRKLAALRSLVKLGRTLGIISWALEIPSLKVEAYRDTSGPGRSGFSSMFSKVRERKDAKGIRDVALLRLLFDLGLRRGEVVSLDLEDVDAENSRLMVMGKGRLQKEALSLPSRTMEALLEWIAVRGLEAGPLFFNLDRAKKGGKRLSGTSLYRIVRDYGKEVGLKTRPHGIRHTAITEAVKVAHENGIGLDEVLQFSRHKDVKTLMIYRDRERNVQGQLAGLVAAAV